MAVLSVTRLPNETGRTSKTGGSRGEEIVNDSTHTYQVVCDNPLDDEVVVRRDRRVPQVGQQHQSDPTSFVRAVLPERTAESRVVWLVTVEYSSDFDNTQDENPLNRHARISGDYESYSEPAYFDADGDPLINTAGDLILGIEEEKADLVLHVEKDLPPILPNWVLGGYENSVNDGAIRLLGRTFPRGTLKLKGLRFGQVQYASVNQQRIAYFTLSFNLHFRARGWERTYPNTGFYELEFYQKVEAGKSVTRARRVPILINGERPTDPLWLDKNGRRPRITEVGPTFGDVKEQLEPKDLVTLKFKLAKERPFSVLPLK